ncbi:MAG: cytochrome C [Desulfuromonas sp.]|nr:MAG: cytochrome C [Desulfuromonas sp.]
MKRLARHILITSALLCWATSFPCAAKDAVPAEAAAQGNDFCALCHPDIATTIANDGQAHKTDVSCEDCHAGHKPKSMENIPYCSMCHTEEPHYELEQCLICHRDPHQPLQIKLPKKAQTACLTCHEQPGLDMAASPSYHSSLVCTDCHGSHGYMPECMSCHNGHSQDMTEANCQDCHAPHKPLEMVFAHSDFPSSFCAQCHEQAATLLAASPRKHRDVNCASCHQQHGRIPDCRDCHGQPHPETLHQKFPSCSECHGIAHDLE